MNSPEILLLAAHTAVPRVPVCYAWGPQTSGTHLLSYLISSLNMVNLSGARRRRRE